MPIDKPRIFIGSSTPGYDSAQALKDHLSSSGDCYLWKEPGIWEPNQSTFDNLIRMCGYFDFGVFVATADDLTLHNNAIVIEPRDNVILEMALFLGAMGRDKSFLLVEDGIQLPSDFDSIYMPRFKKGDPQSLQQAAEQYRQRIEENYEQGYLSLYPTTALAMGYYRNFLSGLVDSIQEADPLELDGIRYTDFKINVVMPADLKGSVRERAAQFYKRNKLVENTIRTKFRRHPAWFRLDPAAAPIATIYDMPSTLTGIDDAIEMTLRKGFQGRTKMQDLIEQRELNNFKRVLRILIEKSPYAQSAVQICDEF